MTLSAELKQLDVAFLTQSGPLMALDDVCFCLKRGELLALLGESGSGKSLTAAAIMRLLPMHTAYGEHSAIRIHEKDILTLPEREMRRLRGQRISMIFQEPMTALNPVLTIGAQLAEAICAHQRLTRRALNERMLALLSEVELQEPEHRLRQYPHQLSGGQKQRVVIAMALANHPDLLIADEPTTALDVTVQAQILALLKKLQKRHEMSVLLITHDLGVVQAVADRVCVMYGGQVVELAKAADFFQSVRHPYSQQLMAALPDLQTRGQWLRPIKGQVPSLSDRPAGCRFHPRCEHRFLPCNRIEPSLQTLSESRQVRCHLFPEHEQLPPLLQERVDWETKTGDENVLLRAENLNITFYLGRTWWSKGTRIVAAKDVSFEVKAGKTLALVGESGCGKTTTSRALLRLQPLSSGRVLYQGEDISQFQGNALRAYRKKVQVVFQDPFSSMNPRMMVKDILSEGLKAQGVKPALMDQRIGALLEKVNLPKTCLMRYPHQFSGGQRQRICIARALVVEPEILICDEPTSALDVSVQAQILNLLKSLQHETGLSYVFITHNMAVVSYMADEVMVMRHGEIIEQASCERLFANPQAAYTRELLRSAHTPCG